MRHQSQLHLRIVCRQQQMPVVARDECLANGSANLLANGYVLQIRIGRRQPTCGGNRLIVRCMNVSRNGIDQQRQGIDIGREQFFDAAILQYRIDYGMLVRKALQILLVGAELLGFGHLGLVGNAHLRKEQLAQLSARIDVECRVVRHGANPLLQRRQLLRHGCRIVRQRCAVDAHARPFHIRQYVNQRLLDALVQCRLILLYDRRIERVVELQRDVGILCRILRNALQADHIHSQLFDSATYQRLDFDGRITQIPLRQSVHAVSRFGVEQVVQQHRVVFTSLYPDSQRAQKQDVELHVLSDFGFRLVLEQRAQNGCILAFDFVALRSVGRRIVQIERYVPSLVRLYGKGESYDAVAEYVQARGLQIEAEHIVLQHLCHRFAQRRCIAYDAVVVRYCRYGCHVLRSGVGRLLLICRIRLGNFFDVGTLRLRCRYGGRLDCIEQRALSRHCRPLHGCRLGACHIGELVLLGLFRYA